MLKKRERIIASICKQQTRYLKKSHKFCIELPKAVEQAYALNAKNGNILWADVIKKWRTSAWHLKFYQIENLQP